MDEPGVGRGHGLRNERGLLEWDSLGKCHQNAEMDDDILRPAAVVILSHDQRPEARFHSAADALTADATVSPGHQDNTLARLPERHIGAHARYRARSPVARA